MNEKAPAVEQWLAKANSDWQAVVMLTGHPNSPRDVVCFHCQQYVEKLLKALLTVHSVEAPRTHDLRYLVQLAAKLVPALLKLVDAADALTPYAVEIRYPGDWYKISAAETKKMISVAKKFARIIVPLVR